MTEDNRRAAIATEWARAESALGAARALLREQFFSDAVSRAYYAVFHAAVCLLLTVGIEPRSHRGLIQLFNQHFVRPGRVPGDFGRTLSQMQKYREDADYDPFAVFDERAGRGEVEKAEAFVAAIEALLRAGSWLAPPGA